VGQRGVLARCAALAHLSDNKISAERAGTLVKALDFYCGHFSGISLAHCMFFAVCSKGIHETLSVYYSGESEGRGEGGEEVSHK
jgi:hypothetical protein